MLLQTFLNNIKTIVDSAVVKYNKIAAQNESVISAHIADTYGLIIDGIDTFNTYPQFDEQAIVDAKIPTNSGGFVGIGPVTGLYDDTIYNEPIARDYAINKELIPYNKRNDVLNAQRNLIKNQYRDISTNPSYTVIIGDYNNYYRELSGLPNLGDAGIIIPDEYYTKYKIESLPRTKDDDTPIYVHEYNDATIRKLYNIGLINELLQNNPDKKYLNHLGYKKIDPMVARRSNNFSLLYVDGNDVPLSFYDRFNKLYEQNREYVCTVLYNKQLSNAYEMYDNFMAMCVMFMTIQRMTVDTFNQGIQRDLYDWEFIQRLYASYNIPFNESLPMDTHITIVKNFNNLLRYKSTDKVLFDICSLLGYNDISIERYFLVKSIKMDANNNPIIVSNEDGSVNYSATYDLYFKSIDIKETNISLALQNATATKTYEDVTGSDPLWWDSGDLKNKILEEDFNYFESKYISLNLMYNMTNVLFELTYAFNAIMDNKEKIEQYDISLQLPKIEYGRTFNIFDVCIFIIAGICKLNGFSGNIQKNARDIAYIYGYKHNAFDGTDPLEYLYKNISYKDILTGETITDAKMYAEDEWSGVDSLESFNDLFTAIKNHRNNLVNAMWNAKDINEYTAYRALYDIQMIKENTTTMFTKKDGNEAQTYMEYLRDSEPLLADILENTTSEGNNSLYSVLSHVIGRMEEYFTSLEYLDQLIDDSDVPYRALMSMINFFKSYTVDIHSFNIWYVLDSKYYNAIRLIDHLSIHNNIRINDSYGEMYYDIVHNTSQIKCHDDLCLRHELVKITE